MFWNSKLSLNLRRDAKNEATLKKQGWKVITIWTCQIDRGLRKVLKTLNKLRENRPERKRGSIAALRKLARTD